ncbi:MAG: DUF1501 domain-containing protein [Planctomycetaceae bacterium]|nr:DUF1501 domain-containing protein [Planctomycetaceae bacterium]
MSTEHHPFVDRRRFLSTAFNGIGALAASDLLARETLGASPVIASSVADPLAMRVPHLPRKAKHCIFLFMQGGASQLDSFEYKPELNRFHGQPLPHIPAISGELQGRLSFPHVTIGSPFAFKQYGESGHWFSELYPHLAKHSDKLTMIRGIKTDNQNHGPSTLHVTTGSQFPGSPSVGSWVSYGLGSPNRDLPGYVVIQDPRGAPVNGAAVWANGYLPAAYQGTLLRSNGTPILNLSRPEGVSEAQQRREFDVLALLNRQHQALRPDDSQLAARINAYELAYRMQTEAPELVDLSAETQATQQMYGLNDPDTAGFGRQCLLARRLVERGVRYTLLVHGVQIGRHSWDDHGDVEGGMKRHSREVDQPIGALLSDLEERGLLAETLVVWASEMGRTPFRNGAMGSKPGREHNSWNLVMWMAGGNVKAGASAGVTDDFGLRSVGEGIHIRDVHATILNLMGLDDDQLRYQHAGRLRQLTDIGGYVLDDIIS